ncbi:KEOPS complex subunit Cgi121 [Halarchaeum rubridurum]|uniref:KEOPS complex component n=1 Tax=Halarchaeum rubridurum TaxID=489911 RepID=A0A830G4G9_9EURY|nr:KEOPS complex subunit Cgi121 [Halarchaeum rubridurum]MBP1955741.1 KEOPS complex subunit Cgi121 [Halarchaeum rubridurum]GGM74911.1 KEOPS complex component [Halarchaeum rubridurum]
MKVVEGVADVDDVEAFVETLGDVGDATDCTVQAFDARYVAGRTHLESALAHADRAFERGENVARERAVEVLLYAAGRRQIRRALTMGVEVGETPTVVLVAAETGVADPDEAEQAATNAVAEHLHPGGGFDARDEALIREFFEIPDAERAATDASLADLVRERVALLDVEK